MPRIYSDVQDHSISGVGVDFINGVAFVPSGTDTALWAADSYAIDASKNRLTPFDTMERAGLQRLADYLKVSFTDETTKQELVRAIETALDAFKTTLTITSVAGTASGSSNITVAGAVGTAGNTLAFKSAQTTAPAILYLDEPGAAYTAFVSGADVAPGATHDKITVVELNSAGQVVSVGKQTLTKKA